MSVTITRPIVSVTVQRPSVAVTVNKSTPTVIVQRPSVAVTVNKPNTIITVQRPTVTVLGARFGGLPEAPKDGQPYTRQDGGWVLDIVYDDTDIQAEVDLNTAKVTNVAHPLVETAVPVGAVFTDTVYDDTAIQAEVDLNTAKVTNVAHPLVETAVPVGAVFTDTVYDDTAIQAEVDLNTAKVSASGLETIDEGNGDGLAIINRIATNYGDLGLHAVDLSYSTEASITRGSTGSYSHAEGYNTEASGSYSHAEGANTVASGASSHAEGSGTIALNSYSHAAGKFNIGTDSDTIHETGIGTGTSSRKNAFEIFTDGTLTTPESTVTLIDSRGNKALITKEYISDFYRPSNVLGTVSQSGGVPTGALMEYGSNANGEYWRYAGGLLICNIAGTTGTTGQKSFTLPSNLVNSSTCTVHVLLASSSANTITGKYSAISSTSVSLVFNIVTNSVLSAYLTIDLNCRIVVIGRWF